jgi:TPR repeat protein
LRNNHTTAAKLGDAEAENSLGIMIEELGDLFYGDTSEDNNGDTKEEATKEENQTMPGSSSRSGSNHSSNHRGAREPRFLGKDPVGAGLWYRRAAFNGNPYALLNLARLYATGKGVGRDLSYAAKLLRQAGAAGVVQASVELVRLVVVAVWYFLLALVVYLTPTFFLFFFLFISLLC